MNFFYKNKFICLAIFALTMASAPNKKNVSSNIKKADSAFANQNFAEAIRLYGSDTNSSNNTYSMLQIAECLMHLNIPYAGILAYLESLKHPAADKYKSKALLGFAKSSYGKGLADSEFVIKKIGSIKTSLSGPAMIVQNYILGKNEFMHGKYKNALNYFNKASKSKSFYGTRAVFYQGVIASLQGDYTNAIAYFKKAQNKGGDDDEFESGIDIEIARAYYAANEPLKAISYYAKIPRKSRMWLDAIFESAWAFFKIEQANHTLGNIHTLQSPFFIKFPYPEVYILEAITYLKMCHYDNVKVAIEKFHEEYLPLLKNLKNFENRYKKGGKDVLNIANDLSQQQIEELKPFEMVLADLAKAAFFSSGKLIISGIKDSKKSLSEIARVPFILKIEEDLMSLHDDMVKNISQNILDSLGYLIKNITDLEEQTKLIKAELLLGKVDALRRAFNVSASKNTKTTFIGGLQPLKVGQKLEYWPFEGEYWIDELGGYVFNVASKCEK